MLWLFIPITIVYSIIAAYFSFRLNSGDKVFWITYGLNILPIWTFWSLISKNILFDAIVYDLILIICYSVTLIYLTKQPLNIQHYIGLVLIFLGLIIFKWSF